MFLSSVILVLQEMIEAALLVSMLLVFTHLFQRSWDSSFLLRTRWVVISIVSGALGAAAYSYYTPQISEMFDYMGLEVVNSSFHVLTLVLICLLAFLVPSGGLLRHVEQRSRLAAFSMIGIVVLDIVREGSEVIQYIGGVAGQQENFTPVVLGGLIGAGIGISAGVLLYYALINLSLRWSFRATLILLCLIAGNMGSQAVTLLTQADWLPYTPIAWNSSSLLPEDSIIGRLMYALVGYEATPSLLQLGVYLAGIALVVISPLFRKSWRQQLPQVVGV